ncbi:uncharacterized protein APUU_80404A [Aspergillus puulaauensis]|uniref:Uncharacterized protein n=1 Tax=Aspergillus puulaauensis TaxID=1220207 RepID=A0A7R8AT58_9EURO|nr:uncharacterized protein APUU_80404A [Aspergillus puulaauensis]BCS30101.1 hypothetical protein APUU_80404A [Aspergillus puulaauensis]
MRTPKHGQFISHVIEQLWFLAAWPPCSLAGWGWTSLAVGKPSRHCQAETILRHLPLSAAAGVSCLCEEADQFTYRYPSSAVWPMNKGGHAGFLVMPDARRAPPAPRIQS